MIARLFVVALATIICLGAASNATAQNNSATTKQRAISGGITAEVPDFIPVGQHGCKVLLFHPGFHHLTGSIEGSFVEDGYFLLDKCTGEGFYYVTAAFTGTVLGSEPGTATFKADGRIRNSTIIDLGHFTLVDGMGGLEGVTASGTFNFTMGKGGEFLGFAFIEKDKKAK